MWLQLEKEKKRDMGRMKNVVWHTVNIELKREKKRIIWIVCDAHVCLDTITVCVTSYIGDICRRF